VSDSASGKQVAASIARIAIRELLESNRLQEACAATYERSRPAPTQGIRIFSGSVSEIPDRALVLRRYRHT